MKQKKSSSRKAPKHRHLGWIVLVGIGALAAFGVYWSGRQPVINPGTDDQALVNINHVDSTGTEPRLKNALSVTGQRAISSIVIDQVSLLAPGYVAIHEVNNGVPGKIVAHSGLISAGTKQDLVINLKVTGDWHNYVAMLHSDNGDKKFDATKDLPINNAQGKPIMVEFQVTTLNLD